MDSSEARGEAAINMPADQTTSSRPTKAKPTPPVVMTSSTKASAYNQQARLKKGLAIFDFILRICALVAALVAATTMGTTDETLPFFTRFFRFQASYDDIPAFAYFVVANAIASSYLVLSLPFSVICIVRPHMAGARLLLLMFDTVALAFTTAAAGAAAAIVYLAHNGNANANWFAICQQFGDFCQRVSGAVVGSFIAAVIFILIVVLSGVALTRH